MANVLSKVLKMASKIAVKYGAKALSKVTSFVKKNWKTVSKWIAEWGVWSAIEEIIKRLRLKLSNISAFVEIQKQIYLYCISLGIL